MNPEMLIIDLISAKDVIVLKYHKNYRRHLILSAAALLFSILFFFGVSQAVYSTLAPLVHTISTRYRLYQLYHLAQIIGIGFAVGLGLYFLLTLFRWLRLTFFFDSWLEKRSTAIAVADRISQDAAHFYLLNTSGFHLHKKTAVLKKHSRLLATTIEDTQLVISQTPAVFGFYQTKIFILPEKPETLPPEIKKPISGTVLAAGTLCLLVAIGSIGIRYYVTGPATISELKAATTANYAGFTAKKAADDTTVSDTATAASSASAAVLATQTGSAPAVKTDTTNELNFNQTTDELYMTTDSGSTWTFVPIKGSWLRGGDYTLTSGEVPKGYWMDDTYQVGSTFSWFIYTPDNEAVYFLYSTDNGKTWTKTAFDGQSGTMRYRKVQFFANGSGIAAFSTTGPGGKSSENIALYHTLDYGKTWNRDRGTTLDQAVQNVSFANLTVGFVSTWSAVYYTTDSGLTFNQAVVQVPSDYSTDGIDIFATPNEVTEVNSNVLQTKFNLVKTGSVDIGKMFSCVFQSTDSGATWTFVKQAEVIPAN